MGCFQLGFGASRLGARLGVIQNKQQLTLFDRVAFLDQDAANASRDWSVRLEVGDGLNFSVGRNQAADRALLDDGGSHRHRVIAVRDERNESDDSHKNYKRCHPPTPGLGSRTVSIQCHAEKSASFNVYHPRTAESRQLLGEDLPD